MSEQAAKEQYEVERRVMRGMDNFTDLSLLPDDYYRETKNLTVNGGLHETRPGSTRYGSCTFAGLVGEQHGMTFITTAQGEWCLAHIGAFVYAALVGSGAAPTRLTTTIFGSSSVFPDLDHPSREPFVKCQLEFDINGFRVYKILFRSRGGCRYIEHSEFDGAWTYRDAGVADISFTLATTPGVFAGPFGTYRVRMCGARYISGVKLWESPVTGKTIAGVVADYQEVTLTAALLPTASLSFSNLGGITHIIFQATRVLDMVPGTNFSKNGNDPTIFYEAGTSATGIGSGLPADTGYLLGSLQVPCTDTKNFLVVPAHEISVFYGGLLFFVDKTKSQSRIFIAGADGLTYHNELYNPAQFIPADEADGKSITALEMVGPHLTVWKENKTGVILNADPLGSVTWRDRKIGAPAQGCVSMLTDTQAIVLCHDGVLRVFDGNTYDHGLELGASVEISNPVRNYTERIDPTTVNFVWHREKLHLVHGEVGARRALVFHPRENYEWTPWDGMTHFVNALAENELKWIYMDRDSGQLYEQSPLDPVYLDRDRDVIQWYRHDSALWPKNRRNSMVIEDCFLEGVFTMITEAHFELDEQRVVGAGVGVSPLAGMKANVNQRWFKCWPESEAELRCHSLELILEGIGYSLHRATQYRVIEEASLGVPSVPSERQDVLAYLPAWQAQVVFYSRFELDDAMQYDFSGHRRNMDWYPGDGGRALRSHLADMPPYGGEVLSAMLESSSGWVVRSWDGMDYLGDDDGACSASQTFEAVLARVDASSAYLEDASGVNGTWQIKINADGSVQFQLYTFGATTKRWQWVTAAGVILPSGPLTPYTLQACLSNDGDSMKAWIGLSSAVLAEVTLTRSALAADSGYVGNRILSRGSSLYLSHFRRLGQIRTEPEARIFHNVIKGLM